MLNRSLILAMYTLVCASPIMAWAWIHYFAHFIGHAPDLWNECLAISGICAAYSLDRILDLDPRLNEKEFKALRGVLWSVFVLAVLAAITFLILSQGQQYILVLLCIGLCMLNWFAKKITGAKTLFVTAAWATACFMMPFAEITMTSSLLGHLMLWMAIFALSCVLCDIKDITFDRLRGIKSLAVTLGVAETQRLVGVLLIILCGLSLWGNLPALTVLSAMLLVASRMPQMLAHMLWAPFCIDLLLLLSASVPVFFFAYF